MPQRPVFVSERVTPEPGSFDLFAMSRGEPGVPKAFSWRGQRYQVARVAASRRGMGEERGDVYLRRHAYEIETTDGLRMTLYFERNPSDRNKRKAWWLSSMTFPDPVIETPRLSLRRWTYADREAFRRMTADPEVMRHMHDSVPFSPAEADESLASTIKRYETGYGDWAIEVRASSEIIGESGLTALDGSNEVEIGWILRPRYWGHGFAFEAASAVMRYAYDTLGLTRLVALVRPVNERSIRLIGKLGLRLVGSTTHRGYEMLKYAVER